MKPTIQQFANALMLAGELLGQSDADYCFEGRFRFWLPDEWSLVISRDDADRFRLEVCYRDRVRCTLWTRAEDRARYSALVLSAWQEAAALAA